MAGVWGTRVGRERRPRITHAVRMSVSQTERKKQNDECARMRDARLAQVCEARKGRASLRRTRWQASQRNE